MGYKEERILLLFLTLLFICHLNERNLFRNVIEWQEVKVTFNGLN